jgi:hypothetical protein
VTTNISHIVFSQYEMICGNFTVFKAFEEITVEKVNLEEFAIF